MNNITMMSVDDIIPYANNPRNNKDAVNKVAASIREFGFKQQTGGILWRLKNSKLSTSN